MKNKKILSICIIAVIGFASFMLMPYVHAAYDCPIQYAGDTSINGNNASQPAATDHDQLVACCYQAAKEPFGGVSCRPIDKFLQQLGSAIKCETTANLTAIAETQQNANKLNFNCFTGATPATCRDGWCMLTGTCTVQTGYSCPQGSPYRQDICPGGCGACLPDYVYCPVNVATDPGTCTTAIDCANQNHVCQAKQYGPGVYSESATGSCKNLGKDVANYCTGACTGCAAGYTESGRTLGACIPFAQRFIEIFQDGLTWLGGQTWLGNVHSYDYSVTGPAGLKDVFLKSDVAETINFDNVCNRTDMINILDGLVRTCTISTDCNTGESCSSNGICYTPGATSSACVDSSDCELCYACGTDGKCTNTDQPLRGIGGLFVGLTASTYTGNLNNAAQTGYAEANNLCNSAFTDSHICTSHEIINSYNNVVPGLLSAPAMMWVNNGAPGYSATLSNDCSGWSTNDIATYGSVINISKPGKIANSFYIQPCEFLFPFACCK